MSFTAFVLDKLLHKRIAKFKHLYGSELNAKFENAKEIISIHLYPVGFSRHEQKYEKQTLLDIKRWSYHQIYLVLEDKDIY